MLFSFASNARKCVATALDKPDVHRSDSARHGVCIAALRADFIPKRLADEQLDIAHQFVSPDGAIYKQAVMREASRV